MLIGRFLSPLIVNIFWFVAACFVVMMVWIQIKRVFEYFFPREESYLDDPAPMSVVLRSRGGLSNDEVDRDYYRGFFDKTSTRVALYSVGQFAISSFIWLFGAIVMFFGAVVGMILLMKAVMG